MSRARVVKLVLKVLEHITHSHGTLSEKWGIKGAGILSKQNQILQLRNKTHRNVTPAINRAGPDTEVQVLSNGRVVKNSGKNPDNLSTKNDVMSSGDPVSLMSGKEILSLTDGELPGDFAFLRWQRVYHSAASEDNAGLGFGWRHSLMHTLTFSGDDILWTSDKHITLSFPAPAPDSPSVSNAVMGATLCMGATPGHYWINQGDTLYHFIREGQQPVARLSALGDADERVLEIHYDRDGRAIRLTGERGLGIALTYDETFPHLIATVAPCLYQNNQWLPQPHWVTYHYNQHQQLVAATNALGETEHYHYRDDNLLLKRTLAGGAAFNWEWRGFGKEARCSRQFGNFGQLDIRYQWDAASYTAIETAADGTQRTLVHDADGNLIYEKRADGSEWRWHYEDGLLRQATDATGAITQYDYNRDSTLHQVITPDGIVTRYQQVMGKVRKMTRQGSDAKEMAWHYRYTPEGKIRAHTGPDGTTLHYRYNADGQLIEIQQPDGQSRQFEYDDWGRLLSERRQDGQQTQFRYQALSSRPSAVEDPAGHVTHYQWDALGRLLKLTLPDGHTRQWRYNAYGKVTRFEDESGLVTHYEYAAPLHLLTRKTLPDGSTLHYRYDNTHLQVSEIINAKGERYRLKYTSTGLLAEETGFDNLKTTYHYDLNGTLAGKREYGDQHDAEPWVTHYRRDAAGRLREKILPDGRTVHYQYDGFGQLAAIDEGNDWPLAWQYDNAGRLSAEHQGWGSLRYRYDEHSGTLSGMRLADGLWIDYHQQQGRLLGMTADRQPLLGFEYDNLGQETTRRQGNSLVNHYGYDRLGQLTHHRLTQPGLPDDPAMTLWEQRYQYQASGELSAVTGHDARQFEYDARGQLRAVAWTQEKPENRHAGRSEVFAYDAAGNRTDPHGQATGNRLAFSGDRHFEYDRFGNLIREKRGKEQKLVTTYTYDCQHRLIKVEKPDGTLATYAYDAFNRRISKTVNGETTIFFWSGNTLVAEASGKNEQHWRSYLYQPGTHRPVATVTGSVWDDEKTRTYWYQTDHLGTPHAITDNMGNVVWKGKYSAYGQLVEEWHDEEQPEISNPLRFQGQYYDEESGLHYNLNRYYDPSLGRYITQDPIGLAGGLNQYGYADSNPVGWVDPLGLFKVESNGFEGVNKLQDDLVEVYRVQPVRPNSDIVLGGAFLRGREDGMSILQANNKRKKLLAKIESDDSSVAVNAMQHAQAGGGSSPVISTTLNKSAAENTFQNAIETGREVELLTIRGPRGAGLDFNLELQIRGGRTKPHRFRDAEMEEFGIKDLYVPPKGKGTSKSGFEIIDVKKKSE